MFRVYGSTGEYSDHTEWTVGAVCSKDEAEAKVNQLNNWCKENKCDFNEINWRRDNLRCPHDKNFQCSYTGVIYYYEEMAPL